jgi:hypothetical protein
MQFAENDIHTDLNGIDLKPYLQAGKHDAIRQITNMVRELANTARGRDGNSVTDTARWDLFETLLLRDGGSVSENDLAFITAQLVGEQTLERLALDGMETYAEREVALRLSWLCTA